jgi:hypothetical protein
VKLLENEHESLSLDALGIGIERYANTTSRGWPPSKVNSTLDPVRTTLGGTSAGSFAETAGFRVILSLLQR